MYRTYLFVVCTVFRLTEGCLRFFFFFFLASYEKILSEMQQLAEAPCKFKESFLASDTSEERRKMLQEQLEARCVCVGCVWGLL